MSAWKSSIDAQSETFKANFSANNRLAQELQRVIGHVLAGAPDAVQKRHTGRGKLLVRERIRMLVDPGSNFLELGLLAAYGLYDDDITSAGMVCGVGTIAGVDCVIVANDATIKGGTYYPMTVKKHLRAQQVALENGLPCVYLVDSGGAFLPLQDEVFPDRDHFGRIFYNQAQLSARNIGQIGVVMGSCTAGGAYVPAMCDETVIVRNQGTIFLAGPPLVKAATGEISDPEQLGGGDMHTRLSGVADYLAESDADALAKVRRIVPTLNRAPPRLATPTGYAEPVFPATDLYGIVSADMRFPYDVREVIARLVDGSEFDEFKPRYGTSLVCGFAWIHGWPVGIVANNGILFSESSLKGAHFIQLCNRRGVPLLFLQNVVGFMVGREFEQRGIAKDGAKLVNAVSSARVPKLTVIIGGSFGAGNYGMCGRAYDPRFLWTWPNARISVMGGEQAAMVLATVRRQSVEAQGKSWGAKEEEEFKREIRERYDQQGHPYYASARLWDDGVIDPVDTRAVLGRCLGIVSRGPLPAEGPAGIFRM